MNNCDVCNGQHDPTKHVVAVIEYREVMKEYSCQCGGTCTMCRADCDFTQLMKDRTKKRK